MAFRHRILAAGLVMLMGSPGASIGAEIPAGAFGTPVYDGVVPDATMVKAGLEAYRFEGGRDWPAIREHAPMPLDWSRAGALAVEVENPGDTAFRLLLRVDDDPAADGGDRSLTGITDLAPHARRTIVLPLESGAPGMRGLPPGRVAALPGDQIVAERRGSVDLRHVLALHISGLRSAADRTLLIGPPVLRDAATRRSEPKALADPFGQWVEGEWPEKVRSVADLRAKLRAAAADVRRLAAAAARAADRYGGVGSDAPLRATGYFRTEKVNGRWSLVTPLGHRFFSLGVDAVAASNPTLVAGRAALFEELRPDAGRSQAYDVGAANLARGLGPAWRSVWPGQVIDRLAAWGFNTLGNWSEAGVTETGRMAHVVFYDVEGDSGLVPMTDGRSLPDPFDPRFAAVADAVAAEMTARSRHDPLLIGYFSGNELPWGTDDAPEAGIAAHVLALGAASAAKQVLIGSLQARYRTPAAFAAAWGLAAFGTWQQSLAAPLSLPDRLGTAARADIAAYEARFAETYFRTVALAIKAHDPNHLYLGTRFAARTAAVVRACARWCDVMSFNVYGATPAEDAAAWRPFDKPVLIGEFHFGSTDRGSFWPGMMAVAREEDRGPAYAAYVEAAVADPQIVGTHWYQYADEPLTGRPYDGENGHIGLVAVTDVPYGRFVAAVAAANRQVMERFAAAGRPDLRGMQEP